ncbi:unnamed protein product [Acanthoscelides obtectus]|uniref:DDE Tnp4 domain-containing protein n=1 Tax=Acanthoscelides obtectus TaxID=200917 RepID=A0A9P0QB96_ACAOB|nr:unnamed protein product [Acanthoscelides obtectus]CAK1685320.1 hypothetical protein AOBTE_LOCUS35328 [Acanthoscelides obtectus]
MVDFTMGNYTRNIAILIWNTSPTSRDVPSHIPVYVTSVGFGHHTKIVAIQQLSDSPAGKTFLSANSSSKEICSLDEDGDIILWRVVVKQSTYSSKSPGADCKEVVLVKSTHVLLRSMYPDISDLVCTDFVLDTSNNNYAFISTNYGFIIHYFIKGGGNSVRTFQPGAEINYNRLSKQERVIIERCFGLLKCRFSILQYVCCVKLGNVPKIIIALRTCRSRYKYRSTCYFFLEDIFASIRSAHSPPTFC